MDGKIKRIAFLGLFMALLVIATSVFRFPVPTFNLYFNLGEAVIYLVALLYGGPAGAVIGGVGSALSDVLGGYPVWAPITFAIKGAEGFVVGMLSKRYKPYFAVSAGAVLMMAGYAAAAGLLYGSGAVPLELAGDFVQTSMGGIIAIMLYKRLKKILV
ncbi:ECF transporter S component [Lutispora sp.]|uniref:ECF transporter S component n=1 Tax=Lutispora sp. TaxID=2828727 RepID=UPI002B21BB24|nr:ECF transporter S component [Lutispora sp.]MEA4961460.1 ECF transporter S component [Lutispora sp.]